MVLKAGKNRLLVEYVEAKEMSSGGIIIPDEAKEAQIIESKVIGSNDTVFFALEGAVTIVIRDKKYFLVHVDNILAVDETSEEDANA